MNSTFVYQTIIPLALSEQVAAGTLLKPAASQDSFSAANSGADPFIGLALVGGDAGDVVNVQIGGLASVPYSGDLELGDFVTAGAGGSMVKAQSGDRLFGTVVYREDGLIHVYLSAGKLP